MKKILLSLLILPLTSGAVVLTDSQAFLVNNYMGAVANEVQLGTALQGGLMTPVDGSVTAAKLASDAVTSVKILAANVTTVKIADANVTLAKLATGITPSHVIKYAAKYTTLGGSATEAITVSGVASTDIVLCQLQDKGVTPRTILTCKPTTNTITVIFSGDPSTDHVVSYEVIRAAS